MAKAKKQEQQHIFTGRVRVTLLQPHRHGGMVMRAGDVIEVSQRQAEWLEAKGVINGPEPILEEV